MFNWISFLTYIITSTLTPGPNNLLSLSNSSKVGFKKNFILTLGMFTGVLIIMIVCALFSTALYKFIPDVKIYLQIICAIYMAWLIIKLWLPHKTKQSKERGNGYFTGMILQLINVKLYLYAFSTMSIYVLPSFDNLLIICAFAVGMSIMCLISINLWGAFGHLFKKVFDNHPILTNIILTILLGYCIVSIFH